MVCVLSIQNISILNLIFSIEHKIIQLFTYITGGYAGTSNNSGNANSPGNSRNISNPRNMSNNRSMYSGGTNRTDNPQIAGVSDDNDGPGVHWAWKVGDQCVARYWEDERVSFNVCFRFCFLLIV